MRAGRKRKSTVLRSTSGKSRGEPHVVDPIRLFVRERELILAGVPDAFAKANSHNALAGFTLGQLYLRHQADNGDPGSINEKQFHAGETWSNIVHQHAALHGYSLRIHSPSFVMVGGGQDCSPDPEAETVKRIREEWTACYKVLMQECKSQGMRLRNVVFGVCVENWPVGQLARSDFGTLRVGLNALARVLR